MLTDNQKKIIEEVVKDSKITIRKPSKFVGIAENNIENNIKIIKEMGVLKRIDPAKGGYWQVIK